MSSSEDYHYLLPVSAAQVHQLMQSLDGGELSQSLDRGELPGSGALRLLLALAGEWNGLKLTDINADRRLRGERVHRSLVQGVLVLSAFAESEELSTTELAERVGMQRTTGWRFARTWTAMGVLEQTRKSHRYRLARTLR
ncbi:MAG TPA: helix-turn-helix domain-containing protein [Solirubrobacteraceae bacterium]|nr:helix-turn-helix domain-containing protein [Solirubrobacteraceae bacterium]